MPKTDKGPAQPTRVCRIACPPKKSIKLGSSPMNTGVISYQYNSILTCSTACTLNGSRTPALPGRACRGDFGVPVVESGVLWVFVSAWYKLTAP